jgi:hypothetical protein
VSLLPFVCAAMRLIVRSYRKLPRRGQRIGAGTCHAACGRPFGYRICAMQRLARAAPCP